MSVFQKIELYCIRVSNVDLLDMLTLTQKSSMNGKNMTISCTALSIVNLLIKQIKLAELTKHARTKLPSNSAEHVLDVFLLQSQKIHRKVRWKNIRRT